MPQTLKGSQNEITKEIQAAPVAMMKRCMENFEIVKSHPGK